jgi:hypothetical protein
MYHNIYTVHAQKNTYIKKDKEVKTENGENTGLLVPVTAYWLSLKVVIVVLVG